ncbi:MAG TPA: ankyrin repeat domain-containing protein, partial [Pyrinomonadaceae bacterium]|nr:ankyrin repeat domain-containing protein [Pyrinomonadaceae bacterium]
MAGAAALGRLDVVKGFFAEDGALKPNATKKELNEGFRYACRYSHNNVVAFLLTKDMDLSAHGGDGQTALHWAAIGGHLDTVKLLLRHNPPLEVRNMYGGTVLG